VLIRKGLKPETPHAETSRGMTLTSRTLSLMVALAAVWAQAPATHARSAAASVPTISISNATVKEGGSGTTKAVFKVTLSKGARAMVHYATLDRTATAGSDYEQAKGTLTFRDGETVRRIVVKVFGDPTPELDERFRVILSNATGATIGDRRALGTIENDDGSEPGASPSLSIGDATVAEGNSGTTSAVFDVTLSAASAGTVTVDFATTAGSATAAVDFHPATGTLTFNPGETAKSVTVKVDGDTTVETNETFLVILSNASGAAITGGTGFGTITNDDTLPSISIAAATVTEGNSGTTSAAFNLTLSAPSGSTVTVDYATVDGSAVAPGDYTAGSGTVTFNPGQISKQIVVQVKGDTLNETTEIFSVTLSNPTNATVAGSGSAIGTITNDDAIPTLSINNVTALEGNAGLTNFVFTVTLSAASGQTVTVDFATANGSAVTPGDYVANSGTVTFNPGTTTQTITIQVVGDAVLEGNETFTTNLSNAMNATVSGTGVGTGTITNDD